MLIIYITRVIAFNNSASWPAKMSTITASFLFLAICQVAFGTESETYAAPTIISRSEWGARAPKRPPTNLGQNPPPYVVIHHSASDGCTTRAICQARARSFQNYHMDTKKWGDIGYNFLVGEDGNVYEGRGWGKHGAHSTQFNSKSIGICIIGNFQNRVPNSAAIDATKRLIAYGVASGKIKESYKLLGHRQTASTDCPGNSLYNLIKTWDRWSTTA